MLRSDFVLPTRVEKDTEKLTGSYGEFTIQPLERGFGQTLGNAIRRVLLSSLEGAAVWGVQVEEVLHEFSALPGAVEDMAEIIMNLKRLILAMDRDAAPQVLRLPLGRRGPITAADIDGLGASVKPSCPGHASGSNGQDTASIGGLERLLDAQFAK